MTVFVRDKKACTGRLIVAKDGGVLTRVPCRIFLPSRWLDVSLASITEVTSTYGFFPIVFDDNRYVVMNVCAMLDLLPARVGKITLQEEEYLELRFEAGDKVIRTTTVVRKDTITYNVMDEFIMKGKVPWWGTVDDLCQMFDTAKKHADSNIGNTPQSIEFLVGIIARKLEERSKSLRQTAKTRSDYDLDRIEFISLKSVLYSVNNTVSKLSGAYFHDGVVSAIVNPASKSSRVETILRA